MGVQHAYYNLYNITRHAHDHALSMHNADTHSNQQVRESHMLLIWKVGHHAHEA